MWYVAGNEEDLQGEDSKACCKEAARKQQRTACICAFSVAQARNVSSGVTHRRIAEENSSRLVEPPKYANIG